MTQINILDFEIANHDVAHGYGEFTWVIELADGRRMFAYADEMHILDAGVLELRCTTTEGPDGERVPRPPVSTLFLRSAAYTCAYLTEKMHPAAVASLAEPTGKQQSRTKGAVNEQVAQARQEHPQAYAPWTNEEDEHLLAVSRELSVDQMAEMFKRKPSAIKSRLRRLGALSAPSRGTEWEHRLPPLHRQ